MEPGGVAPTGTRELGNSRGGRQPTRAAADTTFPVVVAMEALDAWLRDPSSERRVWLGEALSAVVRAAGATGGYLVVNAPPLPRFEVGFGTIADRPTDDRPGLTVHELWAGAADVRLGTLWLAGAAADGALASRALELALAAAWARASAGQTATQLAALDQATQAIASVLDVEEVLQLIVDRVRALVGARYAALGIADAAGRIERFVTSGISAADRAAIGDLPRGRGLLGLIIREGRSFRIGDIGSHPASAGFPPNHPPMTSFLGVPVPARGRPIGNFYLTDKLDAPEFTADDQRLVEMFALHAGIAIENARLHEQVRHLAVVEERDRIGRDLHDSIIQSLYGVSLSLEDVGEMAAEAPDEAQSRVDQAIDALHLTIREIRNFIYGLRPETLDGSDVLAGIAALAEQFRHNTLADVDVRLDPAATPALSAGDGAQLLLLVREAMSNAARHANATELKVDLRTEDGLSVLEIADDGSGFDVAAVAAPGHHGLANMHARAQAIDASLRVLSQPGAGTRIIVALPTTQE